MKRILKILGAFFFILILGILSFGWMLNEPLPKGKAGPKADALAQKMLTTLNYKAYQKTRFLEWSYQGGKNHYRWDKQMGRCNIKWDDFEINLNLVSPKKSKVKKSGVALIGDEGTKAIEKALAYFNNDSFWLVAPYKIFDKGTTRSLVDLEDGTQGLLVTYASGGTTPGDSYLWLFNEEGFPNSYKMWVKIIPIGGLQASWDDWIVAESGAFLPKSHQLGPLELSMGNVKGYHE